MNNDRFRFRTPYYLGEKFAGFQYWEFEHGRVKLIGEYWEPWVSKRDILTAKPDEQCTGLKDKNGILIYKGDTVRYWWNQKTNIGTICWDNYFARFCIANNKEHSTEAPDCLMFVADKKIIEIIGNIHEQKDNK